MKLLIIATVLLATGASAALAHDDFRVIGDLTKVDARLIEVRTPQGRTLEIAINMRTTVSRDKKEIAQTELKSGQYVVVDAYGDGLNDLLAIQIQIVPPPSR